VLYHNTHNLGLHKYVILHDAGIYKEVHYLNNNVTFIYKLLYMYVFLLIMIKVLVRYYTITASSVVIVLLHKILENFEIL